MARQVGSAPLRWVSVAEVQRFATDCIAHAGAPAAHAREMAAVMVEADRRGHFSHGLNRLGMYVDDLQNGTCDGSVRPKLLNETAATAWVDGANGLGPVVGRFCMELAISKALGAGIGWVCAKGSNHFGIAAWYSMMALKKGMIGMAFTNTSPIMGPTRAKERALGTNPLSVAAPAKGGDEFVLDMATTAVALGKVELHQRRRSPIPCGWVQDATGAPTLDPDVALAPTSALMPLGGAELTGGYKGYGLALMVEVLTGVLAGAACGPEVRKWLSDEKRPANLGQCFVAIDPSRFAPGFEDCLGDLLTKLRNLDPVNVEQPVMVAGDPERYQEEATDAAGGIAYHLSIIQATEDLAKKLGVQPMETRSSALCS